MQLNSYHNRFTSQTRNPYQISEPSNCILSDVDRDSLANYRVTEQIHYVPCQCDTSPVGRAVQSRPSNFLQQSRSTILFDSGLINGIKSSVEFVLFITSVVRRRDELLQCSYPFDRHRSRRVDSKPPPIKHTIVQTYDLIH